MEIKTIDIVGAGTMGNGIAQAFAVAGFSVIMADISEAAVQKGVATITGSLDRLIKKEKMSAEQTAAALALIGTATDVAALKDVDLIIEAATENFALKTRVFI